jgi:amino acid transporter
MACADSPTVPDDQAYLLQPRGIAAYCFGSELKLIAAASCRGGLPTSDAAAWTAQMSLHSDSPQPQPAEKFGTFLGVYTPSVLTILGLIMYLRFGWVVGNVGLPITLLIVLLASSITFITALSASAVATNMRVGVGGEYYMISRSLGLELGGMIGIPLFLCRTLSITFYSFGLSESIISLWPGSWAGPPDYAVRVLAAVTIVVITAVSGRSAGLALRLQIPIMLAVGVSMVALVAGVVVGGTRTPELTLTYRTAPEGFWYVFAVFFPAVTGFTAGIGMSGDLRDPRRSIPRGTMLAVLTGLAVYLLVPVLLSASARVTPAELAAPGVIIWTSIAVLGPWLVFPGVWGAILSSAFGSVLGGPRVLQALAKDGLAPKFLARLSSRGQPTIATWISGAIALAAVALGGLNAVAQFVTILFLTLYVVLNFAAAVEKWAGDPSYRPTIEVPWYVSLLGSAGAVFVMFLINPIACVFALSLETLLYFYLRQRAMKKRWGDARAGMWVALARFALLRLREHVPDPRNWRPNILVFAGDIAKRTSLVRLASWFDQDRGVITASQLVTGDLKRERIDVKSILAEMNKVLDENGLVAFAEVNVVQDFETGVIDVAQANGIAGLQSNTLMFGWPKRKERLESILRIMRGICSIGKSMVIAHINWKHEPGQGKRIDLWWGGLQHNGDMMLLLAHLLSLNEEWKDAPVVLRSIVESEDERAGMAVSLSELIAEARIEAEAEIIVRTPEQTVTEIIHAQSRTADIVFLGLKEPEFGEEAQYVERLQALAAGLRTVVFVRHAGEFSGRLI